MNATERRLKIEELATWKKNLAYFQGQVSKFGMNPPIDIVNEIDVAERNIKRIHSELDEGHIESTESSMISIIELVTGISKRVESNTQDISRLERIVFRNVARGSVISRKIATVLVFVVYTSLLIKEVRDAIFRNLLYSLAIIFLIAALAALLYYMSTVLVNNRNDDR